MGPCERAAVAAAAKHTWPANPVSVRLAEAAVKAGRAVDEGEGYYPYAGTRREVLAKILEELRDCGPVDDSALTRLCAERATRPVLGCADKHEAGYRGGCGWPCGCGRSVPGRFQVSEC